MCYEEFSTEKRERAWRIHGRNGSAHAVHIGCLRYKEWHEYSNSAHDDWCGECEVWEKVCVDDIGIGQAKERLERMEALLFDEIMWYAD